jgi:alpha-glucosidase (family GH31 glycosyl hydrolase)
MKRLNRREAVQALGTISAGLFLTGTVADAKDNVAHRTNSGPGVQITPLGKHVFRLTIVLADAGKLPAIPNDGSLVERSWPLPTFRRGDISRAENVRCGEMTVAVSPNPLTFTVTGANGKQIQRLSVEPQTGVFTFMTGDTPLLGLGEGGPQFDRRGSTDSMRGGQGGYKLHTHGGRVPIPWLIGTSGWAMFIHQPFGTFDFTEAESKFIPTQPGAALDVFFVGAQDPQTIMAEYARLTGHPEMPPLWSFGYQQSHRTLASRAEILAEAKTFRDKKLPCDALIYLGTGFCPSGWNTENGSFSWNEQVFPDPKEMLRELHQDHFKVVVHAVILADKLRGTVHDACDLARFDEQSAACYWDTHRKVFAEGVDGWWPDEGDPLDIPSRLVRNRMYWEGPQIDHPNERPYALHRNGYAGMQRYGSFLWSGDVYSTWETLRTQVPIGINSGLTGIPYWGTDIGGFVPAKEFTAELYLRWFQFGAFCPLFRCHGRTWKLRLPWGWNMGDPGPVEVRNYDGAATPDASQLHDERVEPICRKYLELRYRMLPYLYSAVRECALTGLPIMRALWLHYADDPQACGRGDEYLWGRDILVAPITEPDADRRLLYLPRGSWYDFWSGERIEGGREITRGVDLETMPLYVRAGAILPLGPVRQYTAEKSEEPLHLTVYPGTDGQFALFEDDGKSFNYRKGEWMGVHMTWNDAKRVLALDLEKGSRMLPPQRRQIEVKVQSEIKEVHFEGKRVEVKF